MSASRKDRIRALLKAIETGDEAAVAVVSPDRYIQHNPQTREGGEGLAALFKRLAKTSPRINVVRAFSDGDYVFAHTEYEFSRSRVGFEVFRFEEELTVEHWDNIQSREGPNPSGHTMTAGPTVATDLDRTEANRALVRAYVDEVLVNRRWDRLADFAADDCTEHSPHIGDGLAALRAALTTRASPGGLAVEYARLHRVLAEGSFVLSVSEGAIAGAHASFYDMFRVARDRIVEHWDTREKIPPRSEWKNDNGKF